MFLTQLYRCDSHLHDQMQIRIALLIRTMGDNALIQTLIKQKKKRDKNFIELLESKFNTFKDLL